MIDGVTTNPTLIAKEGTGQRFEDLIETIIGIIDGPISVEVISTTANGMVAEAETFADMSPDIVIKVPMT